MSKFVKQLSDKKPKAMKRYSRNGKTIVFYRKEGDEKFSFLIENEPELTEQLLANVSAKRLKEREIVFAVKGIFEKIENNLLTFKNLSTMEENPIVKLGETVQKLYGGSIKTEVLDVVGKSHNPVVTVRVTLPDGASFEASGMNQKEAKKIAAVEALDYLHNN